MNSTHSRVIKLTKSSETTYIFSTYYHIYLDFGEEIWKIIHISPVSVDVETSTHHAEVEFNVPLSF
ncbi:hypothetical protein HanXRQr2_Chr16g0736731 [Helianthus annuus]|uniref:Uncharacterized protein n=1 Tax=Helianthus annuus TaxID=4232 RepID=A0A251VID2_HELAN|nr:hypothetical protein HanXRQr2_Chr16g0736731 [Helianthus annuus]